MKKKRVVVLLSWWCALIAVIVAFFATAADAAVALRGDNNNNNNNNKGNNRLTNYDNNDPTATATTTATSSEDEEVEIMMINNNGNHHPLLNSHQHQQHYTGGLSRVGHQRPQAQKRLLQAEEEQQEETTNTNHDNNNNDNHNNSGGNGDHDNDNDDFASLNALYQSVHVPVWPEDPIEYRLLHLNDTWGAGLFDWNVTLTLDRSETAVRQFGIGNVILEAAVATTTTQQQQQQLDYDDGQYTSNATAENNNSASADASVLQIKAGVENVRIVALLRMQWSLSITAVPATSASVGNNTNSSTSTGVVCIPKTGLGFCKEEVEGGAYCNRGLSGALTCPADTIRGTLPLPELQLDPWEVGHVANSAVMEMNITSGISAFASPLQFPAPDSIQLGTPNISVAPHGTTAFETLLSRDALYNLILDQFPILEFLDNVGVNVEGVVDAIYSALEKYVSPMIQVDELVQFAGDKYLFPEFINATAVEEMITSWMEPLQPYLDNNNNNNDNNATNSDADRRVAEYEMVVAAEGQMVQSLLSSPGGDHDGVQLCNYRDASTHTASSSFSVQHLLQSLLAKTQELGDVSEDDEQQQRDDEKKKKNDLTINEMIRSALQKNNNRSGEEEAGDGAVAVLDLTGNNSIDADFSIAVDQVTIPFIAGNLTLYPKRARIYGLDTFTEFSGIEPVGNYSLRMNLAMKLVRMEVDLRAELAPPTGASSAAGVATGTDEENAVLRDMVTIHGSVHGPNFTTAVLMPLDRFKLNKMPLGAFLNAQNMPWCLLTAFHEVQIVDLNLHFKDWSLDVTGFESSPGLRRILSTAVRDIGMVLADPIVKQALPRFVRTDFRDMINSRLREQMTNAAAACGSGTLLGNDTSTSDSKLLDWRDLLLRPERAAEYGGTGTAPYGTAASMVTKLLRDNLLDVDPLTMEPMINSRLPSYIERTGTLLLVRNDYQTRRRRRRRLALDGADPPHLRVAFRHARVEGLNSFGLPLALLDPVPREIAVLNNSATVGAGRGGSLRLVGQLSVMMQHQGHVVQNDVKVGIGLDHAGMVATLLLRVLEAKFLSLSVADMFELNCWLATIPAPVLDRQGKRRYDRGEESSLSLLDLDLTAGGIELIFSCLNCSSPNLYNISALLEQPEASNDVKATVGKLVRLAVSFVQGQDSLLQFFVDRILVDAPKKCPSNELYDENFTATEYEPFALEDSSNAAAPHVVGLVFASLIAVVSVLLIVWTVRWSVARRHRRWLLSLPKDELLALYQLQQAEEKEEATLNNLTKTSLFCNREHLTRASRWLVPVAMAANIGLFMSGHFNTGGTLYAHVQFAGQVMDMELYTFSVVGFMVEMWNGGEKAASVILLVISVLWPYIKLIITLGLWFVPPHWLSVTRRGLMLWWLNELAKWSSVDIIVLVLSITAARTTITSPNLAFLPQGLLAVDVLLVPAWGLYANILAQILSQVTSHWVVFFHRKLCRAASTKLLSRQQPISTMDESVVEDIERKPAAQAKHVETVEDAIPPENVMPSSFYVQEDVVAGASDDVEPLYQHEFKTKHYGGVGTLRVRRGVTVGVVSISAFTVLFVVIGCSIPAFSFHLKGIMGYLAEASQSMNTQNHHSVFSIAALLMDQARFLGGAKAYTGMLVILIMLILCVFLVPIFQMCVLLPQWRFPLRSGLRTKLHQTTEILQLWQYLGLFVVAVLLASWQTGNATERALEPLCAELKGILEAMAEFGILPSDDVVCARFDTAIQPGWYLLLLAVIMLAFLNAFVSMAVNQVELDKKPEGLEGTTHVSSATTEGGASEDAVSIELIRPVRPVFADHFRWLLRPYAQ